MVDVSDMYIPAARIPSVGSRWKRIEPTNVAILGQIVVVTAATAMVVTYSYEQDVAGGSNVERPAVSFLAYFAPVIHDTETLAKMTPKGSIICARCLQGWSAFETGPAECTPHPDPRPPQVVIDEAQAKARAVFEADRRIARLGRPVEVERERFEPGINGLGGAVASRWPW